MALTKRQVATTLSALYLTALTVLAAYALHQANYFSLPIPNLLSALTLALPPLAGLAISSLLALSEKVSSSNKKARRLPIRQIWATVTLLFIIYETVLSTLAGVHINSRSRLTCGLQERWQHMFSTKDAEHVRRIQDAFQCCGFNRVQNMAWPFQDGTHGTDACVVRYEERSERACLGPWSSYEQKVAAMLLVVPIGVFLWKLVLFLAPRAEDSWLPSGVHLPVDSTEQRQRPAIGYRDNPDERNDDESLAGEVERLNSESSLASQVEGSRVLPSQLWHNSHQWARDQERV